MVLCLDTHGQHLLVPYVVFKKRENMKCGGKHVGKRGQEELHGEGGGRI